MNQSVAQALLPATRAGAFQPPALLLALVSAILLSGCGAAYHRDNYWKKNFATSPGYEGYVLDRIRDTTATGWVTIYYADFPATTDDQKLKAQADRNRVINGYLLIADTAYGGFEGGYNTQIASFEIGADLVNLGLTAASAVTPPAALLGAAATGSLGVQHSVEKNGLNSQTRFVITNRMGAIRDRQRALILQRELLPVSCPTTSPGGAGSATQPATASDVCYTLEAAMRDVNEYFYLGTITRALSDIESSTQKISQPQGSQAQAPGQIAFTSKGAATFKVGVAASPSFTVTAIGTPTPSLTSESWPNGVSFKDNGDGTATLGGIPQAGTEGPHTINITAHNGVGQDAKQAFTLTVSP
jgi:hypothetical protein